MSKTTISNSKGIVEGPGSGVSFTDGVTFTTLPKATLQAKTAAATLTEPGVYTVSGSAAMALTMPLASAVPGGIFTLRALSADAHHFTGSAETSGTRVFTQAVSGSEVAESGSDLAVAAGVGNSVTVYSDGVNFCILTSSGSLTISGD
jgi:hypothetical protein